MGSFAFFDRVLLHVTDGCFDPVLGIEILLPLPFRPKRRNLSTRPGVFGVWVHGIGSKLFRGCAFEQIRDDFHFVGVAGNDEMNMFRQN